MEKLEKTIDGFLARCSASESSIRTYRRELNLAEKRLDMPLVQASARKLEGLKKELREEKSGPFRARILRTFYKWAGRPDYVDLLRMKQRIRKISPSEILSLQEVNEMLKAAESLRDRALIATLWESGCRVSELCALNVQDVKEFVSKENGGKVFLTPFFGTVKGGDEQHSTILVEGSDHLKAWLQAYRPSSQDQPLFVNFFRGRLERSGVEKMLKRTAAKAGIDKRVYPHLFRHSRATHLLRLGVSEVMIKKLLGWKPNSPMLSMQYQHLVDIDVYAEVLRKHGMEPPAPLKAGGLIQTEGELRPVLPVTRGPPGPHREEVKPWESLTAEEQAKLIARALVDEQASRPPPAWSTPQPYLETIEALQKRLAVLEAKLGEK